MLFRRFYDDQLAQASYLIGCQTTGEAIVVDPNRDVDPYLATAEAEGLTITAVTETHIHADFVSGVRELAARTEARMLLSAAGPPEWQYCFRDDPGFVGLRGGEPVRIGRLLLEPIHTPGHTPEHLSFLLTDGAASTEPMGILTGDFVFVGDVGRPDLLERAARIPGASEASARALFRSLSRFKQLPDHLQVWPGHGAGSACGKGIGAVPQSTVGYERRTNWALAIGEEDAFVVAALAGQPEPPRYFGVMKRVNRDGPALLGGLARPERIGAAHLQHVLGGAAVVVDTRPAGSFAAGHLPGSINLPLGRGFTTYAGSVLPYDADLYLLLDEAGAALDAVVRNLALIGLDRVRGYLGPEALARWTGGGATLGTVSQLAPRSLTARRRQEVFLIDVRGETEWRAARLAGAHLIPLPELVDRLDEVPSDRPIVVHCQSGGRSAIAASVLQARGLREVADLTGGLAAWVGEGGELEAG